MIRRFASRAALPFVLLLAVLVSAPRLYAAPTTTLLGANINPSALGQQVSFTATVTAVSGTPTGTVEFADNGTIIGAAALDSAGVATFLTAVLAAGSHAITAVYSGASGFDPSSSSMTQVVNPRPTAMTVSVSAMPVGVRVQSD